MKKTLVLACVIAGFLASCSSSKKEEFDSSIAVPDSLLPKTTVTTTTPTAVQPLTPAGMPQPLTVGNTGNVVPVTTNGQPQTITPPVINSSLTSPAATTVATSAGMNPPHGQPGHRCDIAVGAPLNSKPNAPAATTTTVPQQNIVTSTPVATPVKTAPGMNPPHGEPGHRCDITVGAPLNSKPNVPAVVPTTVPANQPGKADTGTGARSGG